MKLLYAFIFALAFASSQANLWDDIKYDFNDAEYSIREAYRDMVNEIEYLLEKVKHFFSSLLDQRKTELSQIADSFLQQVEKDHSLDPKCKEDVKKHVSEHKTRSISSFFTCSNLTDAMVETGSIMVFSLELTANLTSNFNAIFGRLGQCQSESFLEKPVCWFRAVLDVKSDIENDMNDLSFYKTKVTKLVNDISANVDYCLQPVKKNLTAELHHILDVSKDCQKTTPVVLTPHH